ncbi:MAG: hypothetical protein PHE24_07000, partial [Patescibacteria group bacterium]|nr:hypothetical protein [Patescibacteria group bacterium]
MDNIYQFIKTKSPWKNPGDIILVVLGIIFILFVIFYPFGSYNKRAENNRISQRDSWRLNGGIITDPVTSGPSIERLQSSTNTDLPPGDLQAYYNVYQAPSVLHLRKALNSYLDGTNIGMEGRAVIEKRIIEGSLTGLDSFDKTYYKSKFIVLAIDPYDYGGELVTIIFQDKPDKIFQAWVYWNQENIDYRDFRGF